MCEGEGENQNSDHELKAKETPTVFPDVENPSNNTVNIGSTIVCGWKTHQIQVMYGFFWIKQLEMTTAHVGTILCYFSNKILTGLLW